MTSDLYELPDMDPKENLYYWELRENYGRLESRLMEIIEVLPDDKRQVIQAYISVRDELELEVLKMALGGKKV